MKGSIILGCALTLAFALQLGCAATLSDPDGRENSLEEIQRKYTQLIRWGEIERASVFVDPTQREGFLSYTDAFESIRITDFDTGELAFDEEAETATVEVTYHAYSLITMLEKKIRANQEWYREEGLENSWRVQPELEGIVHALHGEPR